MGNYSHCLLLLFAILAIGCSSDADPGDETLEPDMVYYPPLGSDSWELVAPSDLGWNTTAQEELVTFLESSDTKAFIVLHRGRIALEYYFGSFSRDSLWYWASAGKTLTAFTLGLAQEDGFLEISDPTSDFLGDGWTSADPAKESLITVEHQVTMTTGLNDLSFDCVSPECLEYLADAGTRWAYHNGPYTLLQEVVSAAANRPFSSYFNTRLRDPIGMDGFWLSTNGLNSVYFSKPRSMARYGLLVLYDGKWDGSTILGDSRYMAEMKNSSQALNPSYGYLWWLNGKESYRAPGLQLSFNGPLIPNAPADTYAGLGKNDQKLYLVPGKDLVIVRMGEDSGDNLLGPTSYDNLLWEKISKVIP